MHPRCLATLALVACAPAPSVTRSPASVPPAADPDEDICPMTVAGTVVRSEPIEGGSALVFQTPGDVAELRRRVRLLARLHGLRVLGTDAATILAATDDLAHGVRLNVRPLEPTRAAAVHNVAALRAVRLARGDCPAVSNDRLVAWLTDGGDARDRTLTRR